MPRGKKKALLPGCGRPLNYKPKKSDGDYVGDLLPNALSEVNIDSGEVGLSLLTIREISMLQFMNRVTDKPEWFNKVNDKEIAEKWKNEVCSNDELNFTPKMADWCIAELRYMASLWAASPENPPPIFVFNGDVLKSDTAVPLEFKQDLQEAVNKFQTAIPEKLKDWHPNSDEKVLDLVHPSLCPLVYGRTRILYDGETTTLDDCIDRCGQGQISGIPHDKQTSEQTEANSYRYRYTEQPKLYSQKFQWLPCEVDISGEQAKIMSYINNLHPKKEMSLYGLIERLIDTAIPLWNVTLAPLADKTFYHQRRIDYLEVKYDPDPRTWPKSKQLKRGKDEDEYDFYDREEEWVKANRRLVLPEPKGEFEPRQTPRSLDIKTMYERGLQVIVKLANIHLTPEKPNYEGGTWHVEGQLNEHIVATALYYYSCENITTSSLGFRQIGRTEDLEEDVSYEQNDHDWLTAVFGCENESGTVQDIGSVETREGRLITFPNVLQHRVGPFQLADSTKPGHRKIVALFLVDPNIKITSTAHVPCQQQEWWWETVMAAPTQLPRPSTISKIPIELQDGILEGVDFPISLEDAKALRLELMEERKSFMLKQGKSFEETIQFSLCEH